MLVLHATKDLARLQNPIKLKAPILVDGGECVQIDVSDVSVTEERRGRVRNRGMLEGTVGKLDGRGSGKGLGERGTRGGERLGHSELEHCLSFLLFVVKGMS